MPEDMLISNIEIMLLTHGTFIKFCRAIHCLTYQTLFNKLFYYDMHEKSCLPLVYYIETRNMTNDVDKYFSSA